MKKFQEQQSEICSKLNKVLDEMGKMTQKKESKMKRMETKIDDSIIYEKMNVSKLRRDVQAQINREVKKLGRQIETLSDQLETLSDKLFDIS